MLDTIESKMIDHLRSVQISSVRKMAADLEIPKSTLFDYYCALQEKKIHKVVDRVWCKSWFICWCIFPADWKNFIDQQKFANKVYAIYGQGYCVQFVFPSEKSFTALYGGKLRDFIWCTHIEERKFEQAKIS